MYMCVYTYLQVITKLQGVCLKYTHDAQGRVHKNTRQMFNEAVVITFILYYTLYMPTLRKVEVASHVASYGIMLSSYTVEQW